MNEFGSHDKLSDILNLEIADKNTKIAQVTSRSKALDFKSLITVLKSRR